MMLKRACGVRQSTTGKTLDNNSEWSRIPFINESKSKSWDFLKYPRGRIIVHPGIIGDRHPVGLTGPNDVRCECYDWCDNCYRLRMKIAHVEIWRNGYRLLKK